MLKLLFGYIDREVVRFSCCVFKNSKFLKVKFWMILQANEWVNYYSGSKQTVCTLWEIIEFLNQCLIKINYETLLSMQLHLCMQFWMSQRAWCLISLCTALLSQVIYISENFSSKSESCTSESGKKFHNGWPPLHFSIMSGSMQLL